MYRDYKFEIIKNICSFNVKNFDLGHHPGTGYFKDNNYFLLISKNASTTVRNVLAEQNWHYCIRPPIDVEKFYVIVREPYDRWLSGMAEFLCNGFKNNQTEIDSLMDNDSFIRMLVEIGIFDGHTAPQTWYLNSLPMDRLFFYKFNNSVVDRLFKDLNIFVNYEDQKRSELLGEQHNIKNKLEYKVKKLGLTDNIIEHYRFNDLILLTKIQNLS